MAAPLIAVQAPTGTTGSDGLAVFTFPADIDPVFRSIVVDRLLQGEGIDYSVTGARQITFLAPSIPVAGSKIWLLNGIPAASVSTGVSLWRTAAEIVSDAAIEEGLIFAPIADPYASSDPNVLQLTALLKSVGRAVVRERGWTHLQKEFVFQTVNGQAVYPLPSDFREMIDQTGWDRTTLYQLGGPIGAEVWQLAKAIHIVGSVYPFMRFQGGQVSFTPTPTAIQTIAFEYRSWYWVRPAGQTSPTSDTPSLATDVVCLNSALMVCALKLAWEKAKRMDTTTAQADYDRALAAAMNEDAAAPEIPIGGGGESSPVRDVWSNVPQTGIGQ